MRRSELGLLLGVLAVAAALGGCAKSDPTKVGDLAFQLGQYSRAVELYKKALKDAPQDIELRKKLARAYGLWGEFDQADATFQEILKMAPEHTEVLVELAGVSISRAATARQGNAPPATVERLWSEATERLDRAAQANAPPAFVQQYWGRYYVQHGDLELAVQAYEDAVAADPRSVQAREELIDLYMAQGTRELDKGTELAQELLKQDPSNVTAGLALARICRVKNELEKGIEQLQQILPAHKHDWRVYQELALSYLSLRQMDRALEAANEASKLNKMAVLARYVMGAVYLDRGDSRTAAAHFEEVAKYESARELAADANAKLGLCRLNLDQLESARQALESSIRLQPTQSEARFYLAQIFRRKGLYEDAVSQLETVLEIDPRNVQATELLLRLLTEKGDLNRAQQLLARLEEIGGSPGGVEPLLREAQIALRATCSAVT